MHVPFSVLSRLRTDSASDRQVKGVSTAALALASLLALRSGLVLCVELPMLSVIQAQESW